MPLGGNRASNVNVGSNDNVNTNLGSGGGSGFWPGHRPRPCGGFPGCGPMPTIPRPRPCSTCGPRPVPIPRPRPCLTCGPYFGNGGQSNTNIGSNGNINTNAGGGS